MEFDIHFDKKILRFPIAHNHFTQSKLETTNHKLQGSRFMIKEGIMKPLLIGLLIPAFFTAASAQDEQLISGKIESGGFGGPVWKVARVNGETAFLSGGRGGWIINHAFVIGGGGYSTMMDVNTGVIDDEEKLYFRMEYSGLELEYIQSSNRVMHWTVQALIGGGHLEIRKHDPDRSLTRDNFFVAVANVNAEINVVKWMRVDVGAGHRLTFGVDAASLTDGDIGGLEAQVTVKFGSF